MAGVSSRILRWIRTPKGMVSTALFVVALTAATYAGFALSSADSTAEPGKSAVDAARFDIDALNAQAADALDEGDLDAAGDLLRRAAALEPGNADTKRLVARLNQAKGTSQSTSPGSQSPATTTTPDGSVEPTPPVVPEDAYLQPFADLGTLLPDQVSGFSVGRKDVGGDNATVVLTPVGSTAAQVTRATMTVLDRGSTDEAAAFVSGLGKAYALGVADVAVGSFTGKFGADSGGIASVAFARGRYAFEVIVVPGGSSGAALKSLSAAVASAFPASSQ